MTARLIYRNATPEVMAWSQDVRRRSQEIAKARYEWMNAIYDTAGVQKDDGDDVPSWQRFRREARAYDSGHMVGITWPKGMDDKLPDGWFRPVKEPHLVRPRGNKKALLREMAQFNRPDQRAELEKRFGMHGRTFAGLGLYSCGIRHEDDGVWVTWASKDIADEPWAQKVGDYGWVQVPLIEYIQRFGEDEAGL